MDRYLIVLQAGKDSHEGMARANHALLYCKDFSEHGFGVKLIFDGAGTEWVAELMKPEHMLHPLFKEVQGKGVIDAICDFCAGAFGVKDLAQKSSIPLRSEYHGHPSIAKYAAEGWRIIVL